MSVEQDSELVDAIRDFVLVENVVVALEDA